MKYDIYYTYQILYNAIPYFIYLYIDYNYYTFKIQLLFTTKCEPI